MSKPLCRKIKTDNVNTMEDSRSETLKYISNNKKGGKVMTRRTILKDIKKNMKEILDLMNKFIRY